MRKTIMECLKKTQIPIDYYNERKVSILNSIVPIAGQHRPAFHIRDNMTRDSYEGIIENFIKIIEKIFAHPLCNRRVCRCQIITSHKTIILFGKRDRDPRVKYPKTLYTSC